MKRLLSSLFCVIFFTALMVSANAATYQIRQLHVSLQPAGMPIGSSWANAISNSGCVAGLYYDTETSRTAITNGNGDLVLFDQGYALGINSLGQAVGYAGGAALWNSSQSSTLLPLPTGATFSLARSINDSGRIVGECWLGTTEVHNYVMLWDIGSEPINLGEGSGNAVNSAGWIAGTTRDTDRKQRTFLWKPDTGMTQLAGGISSQGNGMNDLGQVVGVVTDANGTWACLWDIDGSMKLLDNISGCYTSTAWGINSSGAIVGTCETESGLFAVLWQADGSVVNLGELPTDISSAAYAINDAGTIAGCSVDTLGTPHAVVWEVVAPEPTGIIALIAGIVGLAPLLKRR